MWYLSKKVTIAAAHRLNEYKGPCCNWHGHNWVVWVHCKGDELGKDGILIDFNEIKKIVNKYDHTALNSHAEFDTEKGGGNPTAENIAKILCQQIPHCYKVEVIEAEGSHCIYEED